MAAALRSNYADWTVVANHPNCRVLGCDPTLLCTAESQISSMYSGGGITTDCTALHTIVQQVLFLIAL